MTPAKEYAGPRPTRRHALAALSGVLLALSFPKFGNGVVAFFALTPLLVAVHGARPGQALRLGGLSGALEALGTLYWTALVLVRYGGLGWPAALAALLLLSLAVALFPAVFAWMVARWVASSGAPALLAAPIAWVATEVLRAHTLLRFPWMLLGYSQHANLPVLQLAAYTAVYGVSWVVAGVSAVLAYEAVETRSLHRRCTAVIAVSLLLAIWVHGHWVLSRPLSEERRLRVGLVQASIQQDDKWDPAQARAHVNRQIELSRDAAGRGARLVVWPESALPSHFDLSPALAAELGDLTRDLGIYLLFGSDDVEQSAGGLGLFYVGAKMLTPEGEVALRYHKMQLVPFGEYVPLRPLLTLGGRLPAKLVQQVADFTPGDRAVVAQAGDARLGATICYEAIFPNLVRRFTEAGAELLVNITNDAWYGRSSAPDQHFVMAKFRAVENGRYLVRAANTGISAVIDPHGRVVARTELFERTALVEDVRLLGGDTFYARHGDVFGWACFGVAAIATAATFRRRARAPRARKPDASPPAGRGRSAWNLLARLDIGSTFSKEPPSNLPKAAGNKEAEGGVSPYAGTAPHA